MALHPIDSYMCQQGPILLTRINFDPNMDK